MGRRQDSKKYQGRKGQDNHSVIHINSSSSSSSTSSSSSSSSTSSFLLPHSTNQPESRIVSTLNKESFTPLFSVSSSKVPINNGTSNDSTPSVSCNRYKLNRTRPRRLTALDIDQLSDYYDLTLQRWRSEIEVQYNVYQSLLEEMQEKRRTKDTKASDQSGKEEESRSNKKRILNKSDTTKLSKNYQNIDSHQIEQKNKKPMESTANSLKKRKKKINSSDIEIETIPISTKKEDDLNPIVHDLKEIVAAVQAKQRKRRRIIIGDEEEEDEEMEKETSQQFILPSHSARRKAKSPTKRSVLPTNDLSHESNDYNSRRSFQSLTLPGHRSLIIEDDIINNSADDNENDGEENGMTNIQSMLNSFYTRVGEESNIALDGDSDNEEEEPFYQPKRKRNVRRELLYKGPIQNELESIEIGYIRLREEGSIQLINHQNNAIGHDLSVNYFFVEYLQPDNSKLVYVQFYQTTIVERINRTKKRAKRNLKKKMISHPKKNLQSKLNRRNSNKIHKKEKKGEVTNKSNNTRLNNLSALFIDLTSDTSDDELWLPEEEEKEKEDNEEFHLNETSQLIDDKDVDNSNDANDYFNVKDTISDVDKEGELCEYDEIVELVSERHLIGSEVLWHPLSVIQSHRFDNYTPNDLLDHILLLYIAGAITLSVLYSSHQRWFHIRVLITPLTYIADGEMKVFDKHYIEAMNALLRGWTSSHERIEKWDYFNTGTQEELEEEREGEDDGLEKDKSNDDNIFNPHSIYEAARPQPPNHDLSVSEDQKRSNRKEERISDFNSEIEVNINKNAKSDSFSDQIQSNHLINTSFSTGNKNRNLLSTLLGSNKNDKSLNSSSEITSSSYPHLIDIDELKLFGLKPQLRPYQKRAVEWMIEREKHSLLIDINTGQRRINPSITEKYKSELYLYWKECLLPLPISNVSGNRHIDSIWFNVMTGQVCLNPEECDLIEEIRGGILAEEMGLGKTVECLALFIANTRISNKSDEEHSKISIYPLDNKTGTNHSTNQKEELRLLSSNQTSPIEIFPSSDNSNIKQKNQTLPNQDRYCNHLTTEEEDEENEDEKVLQSRTLSLNELKISFNQSFSNAINSQSSATVSTSSVVVGNNTIEEEFIHACYCGDDSVDNRKEWVECESCHTWQHCDCVAFNFTAPPINISNEQLQIGDSVYSFTPDKYICPTCSASSTPQKISATLIVVPDVILSQWKEEIDKHVDKGKFKVLIYTGVRDMKSTASTVAENLRKETELGNNQEEQDTHLINQQPEMKEYDRKVSTENSKEEKDIVLAESKISDAKGEIIDKELKSADNSEPEEEYVKLYDEYDERKKENNLNLNGQAKLRQRQSNRKRRRSKRGWRDQSFSPLQSSSNRTQRSKSLSTDKTLHFNIVRPSQLANYDLVLTTYSVLGQDLYKSPSWLTCRALRNPKKYRILPSPLPSVEYWRVCLDESQLVGEGVAQAAQMCLLLPTVNRWCISGTPILKGLDDLYGLMSFLRLNPYDYRVYWKNCIAAPYQQNHQLAKEKLHTLIKRIMWRNTKESVSTELALPPLHHQLIRLKFTPVEKYYYSWRQEQTALLNSSMRNKQLISSRQPTHSQLQSLFHSLLRLRQACDHPQLGVSTGFVSIQKQTLSMTQLTEKLFLDARISCEEQQRLQFAAMNGLAALYIIKGDYTTAIQLYEEVLGMSIKIEDEDEKRWTEQMETERGRQSKRVVAMDVLQEIHALYNLGEATSIKYQLNQKIQHQTGQESNGNNSNDTNGSIIYTANPVSSSSQLHINFSLSSSTPLSTKLISLIDDRISQLFRRVESLKCKYLEKATAQMLTAKGKFVEAQAELVLKRTPSLAGNQSKKKISTSESLQSSDSIKHWWSLALTYIQQSGFSSSGRDLESFFLKRVKSDLAEGNLTYSKLQERNDISMVDSFRDINGLRFILDNKLVDLETARERVIKKVTNLTTNQPPLETEIALSAHCHNCRIKQIGPFCSHCKLEVLLRHYEEKLYRFRRETGMGAFLATAQNLSQSLILPGSGRRENAELIAKARREAGLPEEDESKKEETQSKMQSEAEVVLRSIHAFLTQFKRTTANPSSSSSSLSSTQSSSNYYSSSSDDLGDLLQLGSLHLSQFLLLKKECVSVRSLSGEHRDLLSAYDELAQTCTRIQIAKQQMTYSNNNTVTDPINSRSNSLTDSLNNTSPQRHELHHERKAREERERVRASIGFIESADIDGLLGHFQNEREAAAVGLKQNETKLKFLATQLQEAKSQKQQLRFTTNLNTENETVNNPVQLNRSEGHLCTVCCETDLVTAKETCVLPCFHRFCVVCIITLLERNSISTGVFACPICRKRVAKKDLVYVAREKKEEEEKSGQIVGGINSSLTLSHSSYPSGLFFFDPLDTVAGSWSTKLSSVVRLIQGIINFRSDNKILVFSEWKDCLDVCAQALKLNNIESLTLITKRLFPSLLHRFNTDNNIRVLLLPIGSSNAGLNLTMANHAILIEPSLNVAWEQQCIGRIYRIGQMRETWVHRFVIEGSVEERIYERNKKVKAKKEAEDGKGGHSGYTVSITQENFPIKENPNHYRISLID